jgi:transposase
MKFLPYNPEQAYLLPPSVKDVLGEKNLCFFIHRVVERLDLSALEEAYGEEGRRACAPALMVKVWLYAYALGITLSRRLEERVREDLAFRYLAGAGQCGQRLLLGRESDRIGDAADRRVRARSQHRL